MTAVHFGFVVKAKEAKQREPGRFVTLKNGRVIFIPEGKRTKWADVKEKVLAQAGKGKRMPLSELAKMRPDSSTRPKHGGVETTYVNDYGEHGRALYKINSHGAAESEVLAYEFSESIGWGIVPETVMPEGTKDVSLQRWVEGETAEEQRLGEMTEEEYSFEFGEEPPMFEEDPRMRMMDLLLRNNDRHLGNIVVDGNEKQWAIDNNLALNPSPYIERGTTELENWTSVNMELRAGDQGMIDAGKDIAKWSKTPAYDDYVGQMRKYLGDQVAGVFQESVAILADWSGRAVAEGEPEPYEYDPWLD